MLRAIVGFALGIAAAASILHAQDTASVAPGDAVKVTAPSRGLTQWPGEFVRLDGDSVVVRGRGSDSTLAVLPVPAITRFEVNHGNKQSHGHVLKGALIGLGTGVVAGLMIPTSAGCGGDPYCELGADLSKGSQVVLLGAAGALLGAGIGALVRTDPYKTISLRPAVSFVPLPRGRIGVGIQARFR